MDIKQSTAITLLLGPFISSTDGITPFTSALAASDVKVHKYGSPAIAAKNSSVAPVHVANGFYNIVFDASDTNTLGHLTVIVQKSGALPFDAVFTVVTAAAYGAAVERAGMDLDYTDD